MIANIIKLMEGVNGTELTPDKRLDLIRDSGTVLYEAVGGSHAYGTSIPTSDVDVRGVFCLPMQEYLSSTSQPVQSISDQRTMVEKKKNDDMFYTLYRLFELLKSSNPTMVELLWMPKDCVRTTSPEMAAIIRNRDVFISKACLGSHFGYANAQIGRARGKNKKVNNPQKMERPKKEDFCRIVSCMPGSPMWTHPDVPLSSKAPFRPIPLSEMPWVKLSDYHVAAVEHTKCTYRMYYYGEESDGVFRGDDMLACSSIPMEDEFPRFSGILLYDENEYEKSVRDWKSYHEWIKNRNEHRWVDQEKGLLSYDQKNMMHCVRLLLSGINIIKNGEPIVRFEGKAQQHLMDIRNGKLKYEDIMCEVEDMVGEMEELSKTSNLPDKINEKAVEELYAEVSKSAWKRLFGEEIIKRLY